MKSSAIDLLQCLKEVLMRCIGGGHGKYCDFKGGTLYARQTVLTIFGVFQKTRMTPHLLA